MAGWAHNIGLPIMAWSFQPEASYIPVQFNGSEPLELDFYYGERAPWGARR